VPSFGVGVDPRARVFVLTFWLALNRPLMGVGRKAKGSLCLELWIMG